MKHSGNQGHITNMGGEGCVVCTESLEFERSSICWLDGGRTVRDGKEGSNSEVKKENLELSGGAVRWITKKSKFKNATSFRETGTSGVNLLWSGELI